MDRAMKAALEGQGRQSKKEVKLPPALEKNIDHVSELVIAIEKEGYENNMIPFSQHAEKIKEGARAALLTIYEQMQRGKKVLKERFEKQELAQEPVPEESSFSLFETGSKKIKEKCSKPDFTPDDTKSIMEQMGLSWGFMDRSYQVGKSLLEEKNYEDALCVFLFLKSLQPSVFEYRLGEATSYHELGKIEEAIESYTISLLLQPENPLIFFQLAHCFYQEKEKESAMQALELCIEYANQQSGHDELLKEATSFKQILKSQKAA